ncbi:glutaredoxin family protein [Paucibacter sp. B2R-40]|uniref:glutaredoxin family protein n=1 Tax=Paucibacter sp. B2R-40 TaxID=2893554 RepID=UPI0021E41BF1|nr:glutaredoxin family protein [Paucibacter sp. B2R-40]MCV2354391.1 glutaredoxin family protein [Paucibacter sp. B2R-40]
MPTSDTNAAPALTRKGRNLRRLREFAPLLLIVLLVMGASQLAQHWQARSQGDSMRTLARPGDIVMLSSTDCVFCRRARSWLDAEKISYSECFIETNAACAELYRAQMAPGTPTFLVRGQRMVGFDKQRMVELLAAGKKA